MHFVPLLIKLRVKWSMSKTPALHDFEVTLISHLRPPDSHIAPEVVLFLWDEMILPLAEQERTVKRFNTGYFRIITTKFFR